MQDLNVNANEAKAAAEEMKGESAAKFKEYEEKVKLLEQEKETAQRKAQEMIRLMNETRESNQMLIKAIDVHK